MKFSHKPPLPKVEYFYALYSSLLSMAAGIYTATYRGLPASYMYHILYLSNMTIGKLCVEDSTRIT